MSGTRCIIIITGNRLQALMRQLLSTGAIGNSAMEYAIGNAESLCELGTGLYDGEEIFNDDQALRASQMMIALNAIVQPLVDAGQHFSRHALALIDTAVAAFLNVSAALLAEVS